MTLRRLGRGRALRFSVLPAAGAVVILAFALCVPGAGAAQLIKPSFTVGVGSVLPTEGGVTQLSVSCPGRDKGACRGSVSLVPRGQTAQALGPQALATRSFDLKTGGDADLRLHLDADARGGLTSGPLFVTAVLRSAGVNAPVGERQEAVAHEQLQRPSAPPTKTRAPTATASGDVTYSWKYDIRPGSAIGLPDFSCPSSAPQVAEGREHRSPGKIADIVEAEGKIEVSASDGTGYAGFDRASTSRIQGGIHEWTTMTGWPEGTLFYNSIWAPLFKAGHFSLKVTCTDVGGLSGAARLIGWWDVDGPYLQNFFPWKW
jgi:hypothetical protein